MLQVVQRTFSGEVSTGVRLQAECLSRMFAFGNCWRFIRVGILATIHNYGFITSPSGLRANIGVCSGNVGFGGRDAFVNHALNYDPFTWSGGETNCDNMGYNANSGLPYYGMTNIQGRLVYYKGNVAYPAAADFSTIQSFKFSATNGTLQRRTPFFFTITKGAIGTNYTATIGTPTVAQSNLDCTNRTFMELMHAMTPVTYGAITYSNASAPTVQVMENTWGPLDSFNMMWSCNHIGLEVHGITVIRHS